MSGIKKASTKNGSHSGNGKNSTHKPSAAFLKALDVVKGDDEKPKNPKKKKF